MIINFTEHHQNYIKQVFGGWYTKPMQRYLTKRKLFNTKGMPLSTDSIRGYFNNQTKCSKEVRNAMLKCARIEYEAAKKADDKLNKLINAQ
jgi:hypothetical protein